MQCVYINEKNRHQCTKPARGSNSADPFCTMHARVMNFRKPVHSEPPFALPALTGKPEDRVAYLNAVSAALIRNQIDAKTANALTYVVQVSSAQTNIPKDPNAEEDDGGMQFLVNLGRELFPENEYFRTHGHMPPEPPRDEPWNRQPAAPAPADDDADDPDAPSANDGSDPLDSDDSLDHTAA